MKKFSLWKWLVQPVEGKGIGEKICIFFSSWQVLAATLLCIVLIGPLLKFLIGPRIQNVQESIDVKIELDSSEYLLITDKPYFSSDKKNYTNDPFKTKYHYLRYYTKYDRVLIYAGNWISNQRFLGACQNSYHPEIVTWEIGFSYARCTDASGEPIFQLTRKQEFNECN